MSFLKPSPESDTVTVVGGALSAIVKACARIYDSLRRIEEWQERMEAVMAAAIRLSEERRPTGLTDRLTLTEEQFAVLRDRLQETEVSDVKLITAVETFKREMRDEMRMYTPLSVRLWNWIKGNGRE